MPLFITRKKLILASASPRRKQFLDELGIVFTVQPAAAVERPLPQESSSDFALRLAEEKAGIIAERFPDAWVLGADTVVVLDNQILGKPVDEEDAKRLLLLLAGRRHAVVTGFCLLCAGEKRHKSAVVTTQVKFVSFTEELAASYVQTGEPLDKAGAYGIQGVGGFLVETITGSYSNVVGLPLAETLEAMLELGIIAPAVAGG
jgi:septum formation protein